MTNKPHLLFSSILLQLLPNYCYFRLHHPLPLHPASVSVHRHEDLESEDEEDIIDIQLEAELEEDKDSVNEETFLPTATTKKPTKSLRGPPASVLSKKNNRSKSNLRREVDEDQSPNRHPLSQTIHTNRQQQRTNLHPTMAKSGSKTKNREQRAAARQQQLLDKAQAEAKKRPAATDKETTGNEKDTEQENKRLKMELVRMKKRITLINNVKAGKPASGTPKALTDEVKSEVSNFLWANCKFIKNDQFLIKATRLVMQQMELADFDGLEGEDLIEAEEIWVATHKDTVRRQLNYQRNYVHQEIKKLVDRFLKEGRVNDLPDVEEIKMLAKREGMEEGDADEARMKHLFAFYIDELLAKVAGNDRWPASVKSTCTLHD
jgi:hypothetical protein